VEYIGKKRGQPVPLRDEAKRECRDDYECPVCRVRRREKAGDTPPKCHQCGAVMVPMVGVEGGRE